MSQVDAQEQKASKFPSLTVEECAAQFELYAKTHPSKDSAHSLQFCADFLREFSVRSDTVSAARREAFDEAIAIVKESRDYSEQAASEMNPGPMGFLDRDDENCYWAFKAEVRTFDELTRLLEAARDKEK